MLRDILLSVSLTIYLTLFIMYVRLIQILGKHILGSKPGK